MQIHQARVLIQPFALRDQREIQNGKAEFDVAMGALKNSTGR